jgi:predicted nucleic acid-binding Zn ribbon protein
MEAIGDILARLLQRLGLDKEVKGWRVMEDWPLLVGPRISSHTRCVGFRDGTLRVEVDGSAWRHELGFIERDLVYRINRHLGAELIRELRFVLTTRDIQG